MILDLNNVEHVYRGARGACCCGCCGHHIYHSKSAHLSQRGYDVSEGEIDDELFELTIQEINDRNQTVEEGLVSDHVFVESGDELLIAYLYQ